MGINLGGVVPEEDEYLVVSPKNLEENKAKRSQFIEREIEKWKLRPGLEGRTQGQAGKRV